MRNRQFKGLYHLLMVAAAACEWQQARTPFRRAMIGGFAGFHAALAYVDFADKENGEKFFSSETSAPSPGRDKPHSRLRSI